MLLFLDLLLFFSTPEAGEDTQEGGCSFRKMTGLEGKVLILSSFMDSSVHRQQQQLQQQQQQQQQQQLQQKQLHSGGLPEDPPAEVATPTGALPENLFSECETTPEKQRSQKHCCDKCGYKSPHRHALERHNQVVKPSRCTMSSTTFM
jgi:transcription initiation factor TFIID subunit TAF12